MCRFSPGTRCQQFALSLAVGFSRGALVPYQTCFHTLSTSHLDNQRNQSLVWKVGKLHLPVRLMKAQVVGEIYKL